MSENATHVPLHVFISYAREDTASADRLVRDLEAAGMRVWLDKDLEPGTRNWETTVRQAIADAYAVVLVASHHARQSTAVHGELSLADDTHCPMIPAWVAGERWADCVPIPWIASQYVDLRPDAYESQLPVLIARLKALADAASPKHFMYTGGALPPGYCIIDLEERRRSDFLDAIWSGRPTPNVRSVAIRPDAYASFAALTTDLYLEYLRKVVPPYTYGKSWLLIGAPYNDIRRAVVPIAWLRYSLTDDWGPISVRNQEWSSLSPSALGLVPGTRWVVTRKCKRHAIGIVTDNEALASLMDQLSMEDQAIHGSAYKSVDYLFRDPSSAPRQLLSEAESVAPNTNTLAHQYVLTIDDSVDARQYGFNRDTLVIHSIPEWMGHS